MPGKSKRKRGRYSQSKKARSRQRPTSVAQAEVASTSRQPVSGPAAPPLPARARPAAAPLPIQHPYITGELRIIGVLAVLMIVILFVLRAVLA